MHIRRGFTLVELLVVVAIIVALLAILTPSMGRAIELSHVAVCASNTRQLHTISMSYAVDHQTMLPDAFTWMPHTKAGIPDYWRHMWHTDGAIQEGVLWRYLKITDIYMCPTFASVYTHGGPTYTCGHSNITPVLTYSMNAYIGTTGWTDPSTGQLVGLGTLSSVKRSNMALLGEESTWVNPPYSTWALNNGALGVGSIASPVDAVASYHVAPQGDLNRGTSNVVFFDGHVSRHHPSESIELFRF